MVEIEVEIVRTETVKPFSPTPDHLKRFGLSAFDQSSSGTYTPLLLFYRGGDGVPDRLRRLKVSLSEALARFYPVAGRVVKEELYVDCDDGGVDFSETKVNGCGLSDILGCPDENVLGKLLPCFSGGARRVLLVRANVFECGGLAVGLRFGHVLMDACAMSAFLKGWAAAARGDSGVSVGPDLYGVASRFPAAPSTTPRVPVESSCVVCTCSTRRFAFRGPQIAALRDRSASASGERPTRVRAVSALIWKCIVNALTHKPGHEKRSCVIGQPMNFRGRIEPPLPENSIGNMVIPVFIEADEYSELSILAARFKRAQRDAAQNYVTKLQDAEGARKAIREGIEKYVTLLAGDDIEFYIFTCWCGFGWYEADFGWGRPMWVGFVSTDGGKNVVVMLDASDGDGIEIWVTLPEQDMAFFETNPELLEFASLNPSA